MTVVELGCWWSKTALWNLLFQLHRGKESEGACEWTIYWRVLGWDGWNLMSVKSVHRSYARPSSSSQNIPKQSATLEPRVLLCENPLKILTITDTNWSSELIKEGEACICVFNKSPSSDLVSGHEKRPLSLLLKQKMDRRSCIFRTTLNQMG